MNKFIQYPPERLVDSPDVGPILREAGRVSVDAPRLQMNRQKLLLRLREEGVKPPLWTLPIAPRRRIAFAAFALMLLISAGAAAVFYIEPLIFEASQTDAADNEKAAILQKSRRQRSSQRLNHRIEPSQTAETQENAVPTDAGFAPDLEGRAKPKRMVKKAPQQDSTLEAQVKIFNQAKISLASGDPALALTHLNHLNQRYPSGPLRRESDELRAHVLTELKRYQEAANTVKTLIKGKTSMRKKAQLYRFLGDLQVKQNQCENAVESYRLALGLGLSQAESAAAKAGIRKCSRN